MLNIIRMCTLKWYGLVVRDKGTLKSTILQGKMEGERNRGRPKIMYMDDVTEWMALDEITAMRMWWRKEAIKAMHLDGLTTATMVNELS